MTKVLLAVEPEFLSSIKDAYYYYLNDNYINPNMMAFNEKIETAKADAQKMVEEARREVAREILEIIKCGFDNMRDDNMSYIEQKYLGDK